MGCAFPTDDRRGKDILIVAGGIDAAHPEWSGRMGLIPNVLEEENPSPANTVATTCGPPIMIKYTLMSLEKMGFVAEQIYTTLERRMKCGIGICGRCNVGEKYVCTDGRSSRLRT